MQRSDWLPTLDDRPGPKYLRIVDALAEDIYAGRIATGERLPTHRDLAWKLGVTVGTVSRAYAEAERSGLLVGEVGRGSFVRAGARSQQTLAMPDQAPPTAVELGINRPPAALAAPYFARTLRDLADAETLVGLMNYQAHTGRWDHRVAGARLIRRRGLDVAAERVLVTAGAEHAIAASLMAFCEPGDEVLVEQLTWSGVRALASLLRLTLRPIALDAYGAVPEALEAACRSGTARLFYTIPSIQNPTSTTMPADRRRRIAEVARRHGLALVEDDIYGFLDPANTPPLAGFAPERTIYITATSKLMAPSLRVGYAALPEDRVGRFAAAARASNWMAPPVMAEVASRWIADGTADTLLADVGETARRRGAIARDLLDGHRFQLAEHAFHLWLDLPEPWRALDLVNAAKARGVALTPTDLFVPGRRETPHSIRLCLTAPNTEDDLRRGLTVLSELLAQEPEPLLAIA